MKRTIVMLVLIVLIAGLILAIGFLLGAKNLPVFNIKPAAGETEISVHTVLKEVLPIGEYASLAYRYTSVIKDVNSFDIRGWTIPFTTRKYIFTYDGTMKFGIDGSKIRVEEGPAESPPGPAQSQEAARPQGALPLIRIILPPVRILSHEIDDKSIEVFEQSQTIFNEIKIQDAFRVTAERKRELEEKVMASDVVEEARNSAEQQFGALLRNLPGIRGSYDIVFVWEADPQGAENQGTAENRDAAAP
ncbi:MAG: DUF4230 domain-containing protein [Spirochaetaceae bacterium]|jgi:hypothetical protein|nr:DUF4230 domain-containing protein [Spirochaetaceae bacterium]